MILAYRDMTQDELDYWGTQYKTKFIRGQIGTNSDNTYMQIDLEKEGHIEKCKVDFKVGVLE